MKRAVFPVKNASDTQNFVFDFTSMLFPGETLACQVRQTFEAMASNGVIYNAFLNELWYGGLQPSQAIIRRVPSTGVLIGYIVCNGAITQVSAPQSEINDSLVYDPGNHAVWFFSQSTGKLEKIAYDTALELATYSATGISGILVLGSLTGLWSCGLNTAYNSTAGKMSTFSASGVRTDYTTSLNDPISMVYDGSLMWLLCYADAGNSLTLLRAFDTSAHTVTSYTINLHVLAMGINFTRNTIILACTDGGGSIREWDFVNKVLKTTNIAFTPLGTNPNAFVAVNDKIDGVGNVGTFTVLSGPLNPTPSLPTGGAISTVTYDLHTMLQIGSNSVSNTFGLGSATYWGPNVVFTDENSTYDYVVTQSSVTNSGTVQNTAPTALVKTNCPEQIIIQLYSGTDANPQAMVNGNAAYDDSGKKLIQSVTGGFAGNIYDMIATVTTSFGRLITLAGFLKVS